MFERLQRKWKVTGFQLFFIISTFAIGGSLTGYAARKLMPFLGIEQRWLWVIIYIVFITLLWPIAVLLVSIPFGQFAFFLRYIRKIGRKIGIGKVQKADAAHIAIFASGAGSNAQKIIDHFRNNPAIKISLVACNNSSSGVLSMAEKENIPSLLIEKDRLFSGDAYVPVLLEKKISLIVLAGFLWKLPPVLIQAFPNRIINIHPALLPKYGGKGMFGNHVHQAVIDNNEKESGITIHYVDELYDHGQVIFQSSCKVLENDSPDSLALRIRQLEHEYFPKVIEKLVREGTVSHTGHISTVK